MLPIALAAEPCRPISVLRAADSNDTPRQSIAVLRKANPRRGLALSCDAERAARITRPRGCAVATLSIHWYKP